MRVGEAITLGANECKSRYIARELMKFHLKVDTAKLLLDLNSELRGESRFKNLINLYKAGVPLEYITGVASFMDREFKVDKSVLIPRFETEILINKVLDISKRFTNPKICEIGVGSGIISIMLKLNLPNSRVFATDISKDAIFIAKQNAIKHSVDIEFHHTSLLDGIDENFDIIVSNPPYIASDYALDKWVKNEPSIALFGGKKGDEILKDIINLAKFRTKILACEIGYDQKASLSKELKNCGFEYKFYKDLAGFDRGFVAERLLLG